MDEHSPSSKTAHRPPSPLGYIISESPHPSSDPTSTQIGGRYKVRQIGRTVKSLRKKLRRILIRTKPPTSYVPVAHAESITNIDRTPEHKTTIDILPDDVLVLIFDFFRVGHNPHGSSPSHPVLESHGLIHVCQRWRQIIFSSPRRLDLYLLCTYGTPVRKNLGLWPAFPIVIDYVKYPYCSGEVLSPDDEDNIIAALEHPDRVRCLKLPVTDLLLWEWQLAQEEFPMLTQLWLSSNERENVLILDSGFLGGSVPRLQEIRLEGIIFPTLPTFLATATDLVDLHLHRIPHTGYISPEAMVAGLAALARLDILCIEFQSPISRPIRNRSVRAAPLTRVVLPALTYFGFRGASEYLEDLVAQIDAPRLVVIRITYFNQVAFFRVPQLFRFVAQIQIFAQAHATDAHIFFCGTEVYIELLSDQAENRCLFLQVSCQRLDRQVSHLVEVLRQSSAVLSNVGHLSISAYGLQPRWRNGADMHHIEWLELLHQFTAMETLLVSALLAGNLVDALKDIPAVMVPEWLPALRLLYLEDGRMERVEGSITARQLSKLPIAIANSRSEFLDGRESRR